MTETRDPITGLPLRADLEAAFRDACGARQPFAVAMVNVDHLGLVNNREGYEVGDGVLASVGRRLQRSISHEDTACRIAGDRFAVIITNASGDAGRVVAERIRRAVDDYTIDLTGDDVDDAKMVDTTVSIGLALDVSPTATLTSVLARVDAAVCVAKETGRNRLVVASDTAANQVAHLEYAALFETVRTAVEQESFILHSQTIHPLGDFDHPSAEELLTRLDAGPDVMIGPEAFVPLAEADNLIHRIDLWVLNALRQHLIAENERLKGPKPETLGCWFVNVSQRSIETRGFVKELSGLLRALPVQAEQIVFELTETAAVDGFEAVRDFAHAMHDLGARVALDDFGSGTSSLGHLRELPVDFLKIDGSLTRGVATDPSARTSMLAISSIAAVRNITTIAEHVETAEEERVLEDLGIHMAQGYHLSRPQLLERVSNH